MSPASYTGVATAVDAEDELCDALPVVERVSSPPETSQKLIASPAPGAGLVLGGSTRAHPGEVRVLNKDGSITFLTYDEARKRLPPHLRPPG